MWYSQVHNIETFSPVNIQDNSSKKYTYYFANIHCQVGTHPIFIDYDYILGVTKVTCSYWGTCFDGNCLTVILYSVYTCILPQMSILSVCGIEVCHWGHSIGLVTKIDFTQIELVVCRMLFDRLSIIFVPCDVKTRATYCRGSRVFRERRIWDNRCRTVTHWLSKVTTPSESC